MCTHDFTEFDANMNSRCIACGHIITDADRGEIMEDNGYTQYGIGQIIVFSAGMNTPLTGGMLAEALEWHREDWADCKDKMICRDCGNTLPLGFVHYLNCESGAVLAIWP